MRAVAAVLGGALGTAWAGKDVDPPAWAVLGCFAGLSLLILGAIDYVMDVDQ